MTERERLNELALQSMAARKAAAEKHERERVAAITRVVADRKGTDNLHQWCDSVFSGYQLPETGHSLIVSKMPWSYACNVQVYFGDTRLPSWTECVGIAFEHTGPETHHIPRIFLLVLAMAVDSGFEVATEYKRLTLPSMQSVQDHLINYVADLGEGYLQGVFQNHMKGKFWNEV